MLILETRQPKPTEKFCTKIFSIFLVAFIFYCSSQPLHADSLPLNQNSCFTIDTPEKGFPEGITQKHSKKKTLVYYLFIQDFAASFIEIPTSNVSVDSSTISSKYLAGRAAVYDKHNRKVGTCSASFLCMQNESGIFTDISNYLSIDNGLIVTWFTPTTLINLELDSIIHSMVTECIVMASTKVGFNPFFGKTFDLVVSSDDQKIYFQFSKY